MVNRLVRLNFGKLLSGNGGEDMEIAENISALDIAQWFIRNNFDNPRNTKHGNMKLQKLLYFSQLVHIAKNGKVLFNDEMYAFEKGTVIEAVRQKYQYCNSEIIKQSLESENYFSDSVKETLIVVEDIFSKLDAEELSNINHQQKSWKKAYNDSTEGNYHHKYLSEISFDSIVENDLNKVSDMLEAYQSAKKMESGFIKVNGRKFYYDSNEIEITDELTEFLENFEGKDSAYSISYDEEYGIIVY